MMAVVCIYKNYGEKVNCNKTKTVYSQNIN